LTSTSTRTARVSIQLYIVSRECGLSSNSPARNNSSSA
jgi:hypothetical protein